MYEFGTDEYNLRNKLRQQVEKQKALRGNQDD